MYAREELVVLGGVVGNHLSKTIFAESKTLSNISLYATKQGALETSLFLNTNLVLIPMSGSDFNKVF